DLFLGEDVVAEDEALRRAGDALLERMRVDGRGAGTVDGDIEAGANGFELTGDTHAVDLGHYRLQGGEGGELGRAADAFGLARHAIDAAEIRCGAHRGVG